jgi:hypothetical protein
MVITFCMQALSRGTTGFPTSGARLLKRIPFFLAELDTITEVSNAFLLHEFILIITNSWLVRQ